MKCSDNTVNVKDEENSLKKYKTITLIKDKTNKFSENRFKAFFFFHSIQTFRKHVSDKNKTIVIAFLLTIF